MKNDDTQNSNQKRNKQNMQVNNRNITTVSNLPTSTTNAEQPVTTTSVVKTPECSCITYTAIVPSNSNSVTATPQAINTDVTTPTSTVNMANAPRPNNNGCPTTNVVGSNFPTVTFSYSYILKQVENAFWETDVGRDTQRYLEALENGSQDILDELEKKFSSNSSLTATSTPTQRNMAGLIDIGESFDCGITNGGLKNLGVSAGFYGSSSYIEAIAQVRGFSVQAGAQIGTNSVKMSTSDFKQYCFSAWINNVCGGKLGATVGYCLDNGATSLNTNWRNEYGNIGVSLSSNGDFSFGASFIL